MVLYHPNGLEMGFYFTINVVPTTVTFLQERWHRGAGRCRLEVDRTFAFSIRPLNAKGADVEELEEENLERSLQGCTLMTLVKQIGGGEVCGHFHLN